ENLSKRELVKLARQKLAEEKALLREARVQDAEIERLTLERDYLKAQVEMFQRMQFGQKRERFEGDPGQMVLPFEADPAQMEQQQEEIKEKIEYVRRRPNHHGRAKLPEHLPVEEIEIHPDGELSDMVCIGKEATEARERDPAKL